MAKHTVISNAPLEHKGMDFSFLRQEGIRLLEQLVGEFWTNYNPADPGITILEQLCYAITDLSYRLSFEIEDLLAKNPNESEFSSSFFPAQSILPMNPLTLADFRKVVLDVEGVKNAWVEKAEYQTPEIYYTPEAHGLTFQASENGELLLLNGLYRISILKDHKAPVKGDRNAGSPSNMLSGEEIIQAVKNRLHRYRNLCEDFAQIQILPAEEINLRLEVSLEEEYDPDHMVAELYYKLESYFTPHVHFSSLQDQIEKGKTIEEIFTGPLLNQGFIDDDELQAADKKVEIYASDLMRIILAVEGVKTVSELVMTGSKSQEVEEWVLKLDQASVPVLRKFTPNPNDPEQLSLINIIPEKSVWRCHKNGIECNLVPQRAQAYLEELYKKGDSKHSSSGDNTLPIPSGKYRELAEYESLRYYFPENYGVKPGSLPSSINKKRKAQAGQLSGYLTIFDQLLTNAFLQLDKSKKLFSFDVSEEKTSYFSQTLSDIPQDLFTENYESILEKGQPTMEKNRKNRFLNHLAARFGERFLDSSLLAYGTEQDLDQRAKDLSTFLKNYPQLGLQRATALNYTEKSWNTSNVAGLKMRICYLLGIKDVTRRDLANSKEEGFHHIEHILLRPQLEIQAESPFVSFSHPIVRFIESPEQPSTQLLCASEHHGLREGESIQIFSAEGQNVGGAGAQPSSSGIYDGIYSVLNPMDNSFEIEFSAESRLRPAKEPIASETVGKWIRTERPKDPYSFQMSFVFPDWPTRFQKNNFRELVHSILITEVPVHIHFALYWLNQEQMQEWEGKYKSWLEKKTSFYSLEKKAKQKDEDGYQDWLDQHKTAAIVLQKEATEILRFFSFRGLI